MLPVNGVSSINVCHSQPPPLKTIEGTLFQALVEAGAVSQDNADDPVKVKHTYKCDFETFRKNHVGRVSSCCTDWRGRPCRRQYCLHETYHAPPRSSRSRGSREWTLTPRDQDMELCSSAKLIQCKTVTSVNIHHLNIQLMRCTQGLRWEEIHILFS